MASYIASKVERRRSPSGGDGLFAVAPVARGELIVDYSTHDTAQYVTGDELRDMPERYVDYDLQLDDDLYSIMPNGSQPEDSDFINHSCQPSCGIRGSEAIVAMRDIAVGEEITFDYAMTESGGYCLECRCGSPSCRGTVRGSDWQLPHLQAQYRGYFSDYLQRRMR